MSGGTLLDDAVGTALVVVGLVAVVRGILAFGICCVVASAAWFAGSSWPPAGVAHRLPLVIAIVLGMAVLDRRMEPLILAGLGLTAVASILWPTGATTLLLGVALAAASHAILHRGASPASVAPGLLYGYALAALGMLRVGGASTGVESAGYALVVLATTLMLFLRVTRFATGDLVVHLAAAGGDTLLARLQVLLRDPHLAVELGDRIPDAIPGTSITALTWDGSVVGHLRHRQGRGPSRRLVDGLSALATMTVGADALRRRSLATMVELDAAHADFRIAREREIAAMGRKLRAGPLEHLARAETKITDPSLVEQLRRVRHELETLSQELADPSPAGEGWQAALFQRVAASPIPVTVTLDNDPRAVPDAVGRAALLICSEALSNAAKHSRASSIRLTATVAKHILHVEVVDNGTGGADTRGFGLRGMRERVERLRGGLDIDSRPGAGTAVRFWLPLGGGQ